MNDTETSLYGFDVWCENSDFIGSADVYKRRGGWFTVEVEPFLYAERNHRKGFRDEVAARDYARGLAERFMSQAVEHANAEWPEEDNESSHHISTSENGYITNGPQY